MTLAVEPPQIESTELSDDTRLRVVLCGSYRRDREGLNLAYNQLKSKYEILSPLSLEFVDPQAAFVRLASELSESDAAIEQRHLDALTESDFVWLHAPDGYLGPSAVFELGHAKALGIPIFASELPEEPMYAEWITRVKNVDSIVFDQGLRSPGAAVRGLQRYYEREAQRRGWADETPQNTLLLMTEEMGELARAVRKTVGLSRDGGWEGQDVAEEMADVQLYLVHLANTLGIDLAQAVTAKEVVNARRADERRRGLKQTRRAG